MSDFASLRRKHLSEIRAFLPEAIERLSWSRDRVLEEQAHRLRRVIGHAQRSSPFHADRLGSLEASKLELDDLTRLPPMTKDDVMSNWDRVVADRRLRLSDVTAHLQRMLAGEENNPYYLNEFYAAATGGSSGKRGLFVWDWETVLITTAITCRMEAQQDQADPPTESKRTAIVCAGSHVHGSRFLFPMMMDSERDVKILPANLRMSEIVSRLNEYQPDRLIGYSSLVEELCAQALDGQLKIQPRRVSVNSEPLPKQARTMSLEAWGVDIHNQWGAVDVGMLGTEGNSFRGMTMAEDFAIFEAVDAQDRPVADDARADRLLITKLYGQAMPMIRYELTDSVVVDAGDNPDAPGYRRIVEVKGRADNWFVYGDGVKIHPMIFRGILGQNSHISEYQVQQTSGGARVLLIAHGDVAMNALRRDLANALAESGLRGAEISIEIVDDLPRHPETNKLKRFVPMR